MPVSFAGIVVGLFAYANRILLLVSQGIQENRKPQRLTAGRLRGAS